MQTHITRSGLRTAAAAFLALVFAATPLLAHHSFAMYDTSPAAMKTMTGKLVRFIIGANHSSYAMEILNNDGTPVMDPKKPGMPLVWTIETTSAAQLVRQNITVETFKYGTIFTITFSPLRDGRNGGAQQQSGLIMCGMTMPKGGCNEQTGKKY
jgi:hypothetical protein